MSIIITVLVLFFLFTNVSECGRRIINGQEPSIDKAYAVYIYKAMQYAAKNYNTWLCGGALVTNEYIVTSASCVIDVEYMYVVAGYKKYVSYEDIEAKRDKCVANVAKRIVYFCTPKSFELDYNSAPKWAKIDIAVARVESPYDFQHSNFKKFCSYNPTTIPINFEYGYQRPGVDAFVVGWGHNKTWRQESDRQNYNQEYIKYASCVIEDKAICKAAYAKAEGMDKTIDNYMICTSKKQNGSLNDRGEMSVTSKSTADGCDYKKRNSENSNLGRWLVGLVPKPANLYEEEFDRRHILLTQAFTPIVPKTLRENCRRNMVEFTSSNNTSEGTQQYNLTELYNQTRRNGFCQNDHGGPLVTWVGKHEALIGVASVFLINSKRDCVGPFLFTSTQCNGAFLDCALTGGKGNSRRFGVSCLDPPHKKGFDQMEKTISWINHPDGPADNERELLAKIDKPATEAEEFLTTTASEEVTTLKEDTSKDWKIKNNASAAIKPKNYVAHIGKSIVTIELREHDDNTTKRNKHILKNKTNSFPKHVARYVETKETRNRSKENNTLIEKVKKNKTNVDNRYRIYTVTIKIPELQNQEGHKPLLIKKKKGVIKETKSLLAKFAARDVYTATVKVPVKENGAAKVPLPSFEKYLSDVNKDTLTKFKAPDRKVHKPK